MSNEDSLLMSPPWTPVLEQEQFELISPLLLEQTKSWELSLGISSSETSLCSPETTQLHDIRSNYQSHKRFLSFPSAALHCKPQASLHTHSRTMSCMVPQGGLGISFFDQPYPLERKDSACTSSSAISSLSDSSTATAVKEEGQEQQLNPHEMPLSTEDSSEPKWEQPLTAAELRAEKRKMKRFRLTHQQTRYLMSEFARQAHPDAAQRERLSRAIPGLSSRQVQVWFQNR